MIRVKIILLAITVTSSIGFAANLAPLGFSNKQVIFYGKIYSVELSSYPSMFAVEVRECFSGNLKPGQIIKVGFCKKGGFGRVIFDGIDPEKYIGKEIIMVCFSHTERRKTTYYISDAGYQLFLERLPMMDVTGRPEAVKEMREFIQMLNKNSAPDLLRYIEDKNSPSDLRQAGMFFYIHQLKSNDEVKKTLASWRDNPNFPIETQLTVERLSDRYIPGYRNSKQQVELLKKYASSSVPELSEWCIRVLSSQKDKDTQEFLEKLSPDKLTVLGRVALDDASSRNNPKWIDSKERYAMLMTLAGLKLDDDTAEKVLNRIVSAYYEPSCDAATGEKIIEKFISNENIPSASRCKACEYLGNIKKTTTNQKTRYDFLYSILQTSVDVPLKDTAAEVLKKLTPFSEAQMIQLVNLHNRCDITLEGLILEAVDKSNAEIKQSTTAPVR